MCVETWGGCKLTPLSPLEPGVTQSRAPDTSFLQLYPYSLFVPLQYGRHRVLEDPPGQPSDTPARTQTWTRTGTGTGAGTWIRISSQLCVDLIDRRWVWSRHWDTYRCSMDVKGLLCNTNTAGNFTTNSVWGQRKDHFTYISHRIV